MQRATSILYRIVSTQKGIFLIFVAAMLVPNAFLAVTEPYRWSTVAASLLIPGAGYALWGIARPKPGLMILLALPLMILGAFQLVILYLFGDSIIAIDMFMNLFTTNATEAGELLKNLLPAVIGVCVLYLPLIALAVRSITLRERLSARFRVRAAGMAAAMLVAGFACAAWSKHANPGFGFRYHIFPVNVLYNASRTMERWERSEAYPERVKDFRFGAAKTIDTMHREVYVLVIGEASRACNWQLFGYQRPTNPRLSEVSNLVPFADMLTQSNTTHKSVPMMLSPGSAADYDAIYRMKGMIALFREAGFRTLYISNQVPNRSLIDYFAAEAERRIDVSPRASQLITENRYDEDIVSHVERALIEMPGNLLIVIHMYGSHFEYDKRYPADFACFAPGGTPSIRFKYRTLLVNDYDNSIRYTDQVLSEIIGVLDGSGTRSALFYCSDHGEDLMDDRRKRFLHASPIPTYYQIHVASFAWFSDAYRTAWPSRYGSAAAHANDPASTAAVFHTMAGIGGIESPYVMAERSLVSGAYDPDRTRLYLTDYEKAVPFYNVGLKREDFRMLDRHSVEYAREEVRKIRY